MHLAGNFKFNFSVHANVFAPTVTPLVKDSIRYEDQVTFGVDTHYKFSVPTDGSVPSNSYLQVTVDNVNGGLLDIWVNPGRLAGSNQVPLAQRAGKPNAKIGQGWLGPEGCWGNVASCTTAWGCNVVIQPCDFAKWNVMFGGQWFVAVHSTTGILAQQYPFEYRISVTWQQYQAPATLSAGVPSFGAVAEVRVGGRAMRARVVLVVLTPNPLRTSTTFTNST
jgi:hypothetical protein